MSIIIQHISYIHPDKDILFQNISFTINSGDKVALIGNNGSGKSTLLRIIANNLHASGGEISTSSKVYYVPQHFGQYNNLTVAQALKIDDKINALHAITLGDANINNFSILNDDWDIEERAILALSAWGLKHLQLSQQIDVLSGGEKTKLFLAGIDIHAPSIILLDEPSNHLDIRSREKLYKFIKNTKATMVVVSHDRTLLNLLSFTFELTKNGVTAYGGNYEFYKNQRDEELKSLHNKLDSKEKELRQARKTAREAAERKQKLDARGKGKQEKEGAPRIAMKTLKNKAEESSSKLKETHAEKIDELMINTREIRQKLSGQEVLKVNFGIANLHTSKTLVKAENINYKYKDAYLWENPINFEVASGSRTVISGNNGVGKTTLIKLILGIIEPSEGTINRAEFNYLYVDQEYSIIDNKLTVYEMAQKYNLQNLREHEIKTLLHRFLFPLNTWDKGCDKLSGGEKIRLLFCCLSISNNTPDLFVLDEPTNNLDIKSMEIITLTLKQYKGTVLLISHDQYFINEIEINSYINL